MESKKYNQDDKGNKSSLRRVFIPFILTIILSIIVVLFVFVKESYNPEPNYEGLSKVITALLGGGLLGFAAKVIQKKFEK